MSWRDPPVERRRSVARFAAASSGLVVLSGGCFVDALGGGMAEGGGGGAVTSTATVATTGGQTNASSATSSSISAGGSGLGGEGGQGGGACADLALAFDGNDFARFSDGAVDISNDFTVGAWVYPMQPADVVAGDSVRSFVFVIDHANVTDQEGFLLGIGEPNDDGQPWAAFVAYPSNTECAAAFPIVWNQWVHLAGRYRDDVLGDDLYLYVNGMEVARDNCDWLPPVGYDGPLSLGGRAETNGQFFVGLLDDVFIKNGGNLGDIDAPLGCGDDLVAAFDFEGSLSSLCASPSITFALDAAPADPELACPP